MGELGNLAISDSAEAIDGGHGRVCRHRLRTGRGKSRCDVCHSLQKRCGGDRLNDDFVGGRIGPVIGDLGYGNFTHEYFSVLRCYYAGMRATITYLDIPALFF